MSKDENGFFDWLVEDICNTIEIKGAVEATRDENGKVDKWAATGLAMGLGHTSDDEIAMLAGFLGAEGAFDHDTCDDIYLPPTSESKPVLEPEEFEDTFIGTNLVDADDMKLLSEAGYDVFDLLSMESEELKEAMENAGVDTFWYNFD